MAPTQAQNGILMRIILKFKTVVGREDVPIPLVYLHVPYRERNDGGPHTSGIVPSSYLFPGLSTL